ncbi:MAG: cellulase family glycosylhydrolase [Anaerolineaceae bacterium]
MNPIILNGHHFKDRSGRTLVLRGVNLSGSAKVPFHPDGATWNRAGFYDHRDVSFVGRPLPLDEADEHFERLHSWGFTFLRFLITWEAIEHAGPGIYDEAYLDYLYQVVKKAGEHGIQLFIDPHEDVWSRFTGGDGAPGWTLELAGFDLTKIHATGAAILHPEHGDPFPRMIWATNQTKLAAATMFTLFFAGADFAPQLTVDGVSIQEYLQSHYINAVKQVVLRLKDLEHVVGYDTLNEPSAGYIGSKDVRKRSLSLPVDMGDSPTILQGMALGAGISQWVPTYALTLVGSIPTGWRKLNTRGERIWLPGREDIWRQHGVWDVNAAGKPVALKPGYFAEVNGRAVDFNRDYFKPFANRVAHEIRSIDPDTLIFVEGVPSQGDLTWGPSDAPDAIHAAHWYDDLTLVSKSFHNWAAYDTRNVRLVLGAGPVRRSFVNQIGEIVRQSERQMNGAPTLIGEVGIPFDLQGKKAYTTGDFSMQVRALDATMTALEKNFVSFTLWNYTPDNTNARGDLWNDEDLSLFSRDQMTGSGTLDDGGRALKAALRPYPHRVAGEPLSISFDILTAVFEFTFRHDETVAAPTEIYVPRYQYPRGCAVEVSDGAFDLDLPAQTLLYRHTSDRSIHTSRIRPA